MKMIKNWQSGWGFLFRAGLFCGLLRVVLIPTDALNILLPAEYVEGVGRSVTIVYALIVLPLCAPFLARMAGVGAAFTGFFERDTVQESADATSKPIHERQ